MCLYICRAIVYAPVYRSFNLIGKLRPIDSIGLRVERPCQPCRRQIPWYVSRSLGHTNAEFNPTMPSMCTGCFYVLQRRNNNCAIYAIYTVVYGNNFEDGNYTLALVFIPMSKCFWKYTFGEVCWKSYLINRVLGILHQYGVLRFVDKQKWVAQVFSK